MNFFRQFFYSESKYGAFTDPRDGQTYKTVKIGDQIWIAENLNVDHYRNGDPIPQEQDGNKWCDLTTGAWCYYDHDPGNGKKYGKLYNWYAINNPSGLAPEGWHIPKHKEWWTLVKYLGDQFVAGNKLKKTGTEQWASPDAGTTNESGFSVLPSGYRSYIGPFYSMGYDAHFWSSTESDSIRAWCWYLISNDLGIHDDAGTKQDGLSVRCLRD